MSYARAMKRRHEKANGATNGATPVRPLFGPADTGTIILKQPTADHFPSFIYGNGLAWSEMARANFELESPDGYAAWIASCAGINEPTEVERLFRDALTTYKVDRLVAEQDSAAGQHLVLCGAGPSLKEDAAEWVPKGDQVWGCNSALPFLFSAGYHPSHGISVDQTTELLNEWRTTPVVEYLLATTCHPHLVQLLRGRQRKIRFFNNYVGIKNRRPVDCGDGEIMSYEDWLYSILFPATIRTGSGLNTVNRAIDLALFMGFSKITVLGADCAIRFKTPPNGVPGSPEQKRWLEEETVFHADGGHALASNSSMLTLFGNVCVEPSCDGKGCSHDTRAWLTKPDMMISAVWLEIARRQHKGRIELIGDTLPNAIKDKPEAFLKRLPAMVDASGKPLPLSSN